MATKHTKLYDKSPKLERDEDGDMHVKKAEDKTVGEDGSSTQDDGEVKNDPHEEERKSMHSRHEEEMKAMHERHAKDMKEMHKRHSEAKAKDKEKPSDESGDKLIDKVESDKKED